jgi:hypothetical protein
MMRKTLKFSDNYLMYLGGIKELDPDKSVIAENDGHGSHKLIS